MSISRRQLVRVAATGSVVGLAGCSALTGDGPGNDSSDIQAEAVANPAITRQGNPVLTVVWTANRRSNYVSVTVRNATTGDSVETALCGVGAQVRYNGNNGKASTNGPVGSPPNCDSGNPSGLSFGGGDIVEVTVTAHAGDATKEILSDRFTYPTPTPTPTGDGN